MNARPFTALATVTLPYARGPVLESTLRELLTGAVKALRSMGVTLTGGHTVEGAELALGLTVTGHGEEGNLFLKGALRPGDALILTGDRDMFQCVTKRVKVLYLKTGVRGGEVVDAAEVKRRYGVPPELVPDFIALRGDPSDGIPGAKGIGEKTAAELLGRHGSLETAIKGAVRERPARVSGALMDQADELLMFKDLATLRRVKVKRPKDSETNYKRAAKAAADAGMGALAGRLEKTAG